MHTRIHTRAHAIYMLYPSWLGPHIVIANLLPVSTDSLTPLLLFLFSSDPPSLVLFHRLHIVSCNVEGVC